MKSLTIFSILFFYSYNANAIEYFFGLKGSAGFHETYQSIDANAILTSGAINPYSLDEPLNYMDTSILAAANVDINQKILVEWQTFDIYDGGLGLNIYNDPIETKRVALPDTGYGYFLYDLSMMEFDQLAIGIFGKANSSQSQIEYKVTFYNGQEPSGQLFIPQAVPIPESMWLLLPAMIGFIGFRRKSS